MGIALIIAGMAIGLWYGWCRTAAVYQREMALLAIGGPQYWWDGDTGAEAVTAVKAARAAACLIASFIGGIGGAVAYAVFLVFLWCFGL